MVGSETPSRDRATGIEMNPLECSSCFWALTCTNLMWFTRGLLPLRSCIIFSYKHISVCTVIFELVHYAKKKVSFTYFSEYNVGVDGWICQLGFKMKVVLVHFLPEKWVVYCVHSMISKYNYLIPKVMVWFLFTSVWYIYVMTKALNCKINI